MKNIKDITISIFAIIGFVAIVTGFTNESSQEHTVPESHVWTMSSVANTSGKTKMYILNKATGEVRQYVNEEWNK